MATRTEDRIGRRPLPDPDAEQEVDLGGLWRRLVAHWWLPAVGLLIGIVAGYVLAVGGGDVYRAETTLYLGQPFSPTGAAQVQSLQTNPSTVTRIARSESALREAAAASGMRVRQLRGNISTQTVGAGAARRAVPGQSQLIELAVKGPKPGQVQRATEALAAVVIERTSPYVDEKIAGYQDELRSLERNLDTLERQIAAQRAAVNQVGGLSPIDQLVLISQLSSSEDRRTVLEQNRAETERFLALAQEVEKPAIVDDPVAVKTTARSTRNSVLVGAVLGLLLGALAALLWEPLTARTRRAA